MGGLPTISLAAWPHYPRVLVLGALQLGVMGKEVPVVSCGGSGWSGHRDTLRGTFSARTGAFLLLSHLCTLPLSLQTLPILLGPSPIPFLGSHRCWPNG